MLLTSFSKLMRAALVMSFVGICSSIAHADELHCSEFAGNLGAAQKTLFEAGNGLQLQYGNRSVLPLEVMTINGQAAIGTKLYCLDYSKVRTFSGRIKRSENWQSVEGYPFTVTFASGKAVLIIGGLPQIVFNQCETRRPFSGTKCP